MVLFEGRAVELCDSCPAVSSPRGWTDFAVAAQALGDGFFVVGTAVGALVKYSHCCGDKLAELRCDYSSHPGGINDVDVFEETVVSVGDDMTAAVWSASNLDKLAALSGHSGDVISCALGEKWIATGDVDEKIRIYENGRDYALVRVLNHLHDGFIASLFLLSADVLVSSADETSANSLDATMAFTSVAEKPKPITRVNAGNVVYSTAITPEGYIVAVGSFAKAVVWCAPTPVARDLEAFGKSIPRPPLTIKPEGREGSGVPLLTVETSAPSVSAGVCEASAVVSTPGVLSGAGADGPAADIAVYAVGAQSPATGEIPAPARADLVSVASPHLTLDASPSFNLEEVKLKSSDPSAVEALGVQALAIMVAGVMIAFEDLQRNLMFDLAKSFTEVFVSLNINSDMLVRFPEEEVLLGMIAKGLKENTFYSKMNKTAAISGEWRLQHFLRRLRE